METQFHDKVDEYNTLEYTDNSYIMEEFQQKSDIKYNIYKQLGDKYKKENDRFIKAFQLFKILINNVGKLIIPMSLTEEVMETQFYDKVDEYNTLEYTDKSYRKN